MVVRGYPEFMIGEQERSNIGYLILFTGGLCCLNGLMIVAFSLAILVIVSSYAYILKVGAIGTTTARRG